MKAKPTNGYIRKRTSQWMITMVAVFTLTVVGGAALAAPNARAEGAQTAAQQTAQERKDAAQTKLADAKLKACQNREKAINNIMSRIADRGQKQLDVFNKITERTEAFYIDKGKILSNYGVLVADVTDKKTAAQTAVDAVRHSSVSFKCDGTDPKGAAASFKGNLKSEITALKDYKTAVKNLIVGVKSVQGTTTSTNNKTTTGSQQ